VIDFEIFATFNERGFNIWAASGLCEIFII